MAQIRHLAALMLVLLSGLELAHGLVWAPVAGAVIAADPTVLWPLGPARGAAFGLLLAGLAGLIALLTLGAGLGIATGHRYGWWLGLAAALGWTLTGCAPVGLLVLGILMLPDVRELAFPLAVPRG